MFSKIYDREINKGCQFLIGKVQLFNCPEKAEGGSMKISIMCQFLIGKVQL